MPHRSPATSLRLFIGTAFLAALGAAGVPAVHAQLNRAVDSDARDSGVVSGTLIRPQGGNPTSTLTVTIVETNQSTTADKFGAYAFPTVRPGTYSILITGEGYSRLKITDIVVQPGHSLALGAQQMPKVVKDGEVQMMEEVVVSAKRDVQTLEKYVVNDRTIEPFTDSNVDLPRTIDDPQPYYMFNHQSLADSGSLTIEDYLHSHLTMNTASSKPGQATADFGTARGNANNINLGGLSSYTSQQTLILVDGHAWSQTNVGSGVNYQADINGIPFSAVERIEVLPSSAAALYGPNALGGAINIILKRNYAGGELTFSYDNQMSGFDAPIKKVEANYGFSFANGRGHVMLTGSYADTKGITLGDRIGWLNEYYARLLAVDPDLLGGGSNALFGELPLGNTPNISNTTSAKLVLKNGTVLGSSFTFIPAGISPSTPAATLGAALVANAGHYNYAYSPDATEYGLASQIGQGPRIKSFGANVRFDLTSRLTVFADLNTQSDLSYNPYTDTEFGAYVDAGDPFNPFTTDVYVQIPSGPPRIFPYLEKINTKAVTAGFTLKLPLDWKAEGDFTWSASSTYNQFLLSDPSLDGGYFSAGNKVSNPFVDSVAYPVTLPPPESFTYTGDGPSTSDSLEFRASGPLWELWAGKPTLTVGMEHKKSGFHTFHTYFIPQYGNSITSYNDLGTFGQEQKDDAAFGELDLPLVSPHNHIPAVSSLALQAVVRTDYYHMPQRAASYSIVGNPATTPAKVVAPGLGYLHISKYLTTNPTLALAYKPIPDVELRGSYGTGFLPPTTTQTIPNPVISTTTTNVFDPVVGSTYAIHTLGGGNPNLKPQTSHTWDFGIVYAPQNGPLKGLRANIEYQDLVETSVIGSLSAALIAADQKDFGYRVTRDPTTGRITLINIQSLNLFYEKERSYNFSLNYQKETAWGTFGLNAMSTWYPSFVIKKTLATPLAEYSGWANSGGMGSTKTNGELTWMKGPWTAGWTTTYYDAFHTQYSPGDPIFTTSPTASRQPFIDQGSAYIPGQMYHDVFVRYDFGKSPLGHATWSNMLLADVAVTVGIKDLFNSAPPIDINAEPPGRSPFYGSMYTREYWIQLKKAF